MTGLLESIWKLRPYSHAHDKVPVSSHQEG